MPWLLILGGLKRAGSSVLDWLGHRSFWQLVSMGLAIVGIIQHFQLLDARSDAARWHKQYDSEHAGRLSDRKSYQQAQAQAKAKNDATVKRVAEQQQRITDNVEDRYHRDLARLHSELRPSPEGSPGSTGASPDGSATGGSGEASRLPLSDAERMRAAENELQLDRLIDWVLQQSEVDPNQ